MASIRFRNSKYQALVRLHGISTSKTFTKKIHAQQWAKSIEVTIESGQYKAELDLTIELALQRYMDDKIPHDKSSHSHVRNAIAGLGSNKADTLTSHQLVSYRNRRLLTHSPQTVKHELSMINRVLKIAVNEWGYTLPNGIPTVKYPTLPIGRTRRLNKEEEQRLFLHADPYILNIIKVLQNTAMRTGELSKLNKDDINFDTKLADLIDTKNGDDRTIPLNSTAINSLNELIKDSTTDKVLCFSSSYISHRFTKLCRTANIDDMVLHSFRHEAISRLFERGFSIMEVSTISGHRSLASLKRYTHINPISLLERMG